MDKVRQHIEQVEWNRQQDDGQVLLSPAWEVFILGVSNGADHVRGPPRLLSPSIMLARRRRDP
jgi:hypothetical protein